MSNTQKPQPKPETPKQQADKLDAEATRLGNEADERGEQALRPKK